MSRFQVACLLGIVHRDQGPYYVYILYYYLLYLLSSVCWCDSRRLTLWACLAVEDHLSIPFPLYIHIILFALKPKGKRPQVDANINDIRRTHAAMLQLTCIVHCFSICLYSRGSLEVHTYQMNTRLFSDRAICWWTRNFELCLKLMTFQMLSTIIMLRNTLSILLR